MATTSLFRRHVPYIDCNSVMEPIRVKIGFRLPTSTVELVDFDLHIMNDIYKNLDWQNKVLLKTISIRPREMKSIKDRPMISEETVQGFKKRFPALQHIKHLGSKIMLFQEKKRQDPKIKEVSKDVHNDYGLLKARNSSMDINFNSRQYEDLKSNDQNLSRPINKDLQPSGIFTGMEASQRNNFLEPSEKRLSTISSSSDGQISNIITWSKRSYFQRAIKSGLEKLIPNTLDGSQWMEMDFFDIESDYMSEQVLNFGS
jgi:hypothetical protein